MATADDIELEGELDVTPTDPPDGPPTRRLAAAIFLSDMSEMGGLPAADDFGISSAKTSSGLRMVRPTGELDVYTAPRLLAFVDSLVSEGVTEICLDLSQLRFVDSRGLGALVSMTKQLRDVGGSLTVAAPSASLQRLFSISGIDQVIQVVALPPYEPPA